MTTDRPEDQSNELIDDGGERVHATPPPEGMGTSTDTGEGGPQSIVPSQGVPSSGVRPQRAPHLDTTTRDVNILTVS